MDITKPMCERASSTPGYRSQEFSTCLPMGKYACRSCHLDDISTSPTAPSGSSSNSSTRVAGPSTCVEGLACTSTFRTRATACRACCSITSRQVPRSREQGPCGVPSVCQSSAYPTRDRGRGCYGISGCTCA